MLVACRIGKRAPFTPPLRQLTSPKISQQHPAYY